MAGKWTDLTDAIERCDPREDHVGIQLTALSAFVAGPDAAAQYTLRVHGELRMADGAATPGPQLQLLVRVADGTGHVMRTTRCEIRPPWLLPFQIMSVQMVTPVRPSAIRISAHPWPRPRWGRQRRR